MSEELWSTGIPIFLGMVFVAVFLLAQSMFVPIFGTERQAAKRLRKRLDQAIDDLERSPPVSLLREKYLKSLSPAERLLESLPGMTALGRTIEQAGFTMPAYRLVLISIALGAAGLMAMWSFTHGLLLAVAAGALAAGIPLMVINNARNKRLNKIEEQLPEALDIMVRALKAGHPFNETVRLVADEMSDPIAKEFGITFDDLNYGADTRNAFLGFLDRVPSMALMTMITSVLVQRETGGNLSEILDRLSKLVRGRFRFQRKVRTLSAEGRLSAWVLTLVPFVLFGVISVTSPDYLPVLTKDPLGRKIIVAAFIMMVLGIFWMRRIIRIDV